MGSSTTTVYQVHGCMASESRKHQLHRILVVCPWNSDSFVATEIAEQQEIGWHLAVAENPRLAEESRKMKGAAVNEEITKLYENVDSYAAEDRWRFDLPLPLRLQKPLRSRRRWLTLTNVLVEKSTNNDTRGQSHITTFFETLGTLPRRLNRQRDSVLLPTFFQTTLSVQRPLDPASRSL